MHISRFSVKNMKCFWDSGEICLGTGVNVFCGANNSGKSSLLQSLRLLGNIIFQPEDHRFRDFTPQEYRNKSEPNNRVEILLSIELTDTCYCYSSNRVKRATDHSNRRAACISSPESGKEISDAF